MTFLGMLPSTRLQLFHEQVPTGIAQEKPPWQCSLGMGHDLAQKEEEEAPRHEVAEVEHVSSGG